MFMTVLRHQLPASVLAGHSILIILPLQPSCEVVSMALSEPFPKGWEYGMEMRVQHGKVTRFK